MKISVAAGGDGEHGCGSGGDVECESVFATFSRERPNCHDERADEAGNGDVHERAEQRDSDADNRTGIGEIALVRGSAN